MAKIKCGDRIVFGRCKRNKEMLEDGDGGVTLGKIYTVTRIPDSHELCFIDDVGDVNQAGMDKVTSYGKATVIVE
jgi:hypothetical protein